MKNAIDLIKRYEGLHLSAYLCPAGVWTIGWGHTKGVFPEMTVSTDEAEDLLCKDVAIIFGKLNLICTDTGVSLSPNQLSALASFIFNVGFNAFAISTLWKLIRSNPNHPDIAYQFTRWIYAAGKVMPGLIKRRQEEAALYFK